MEARLGEYLQQLALLEQEDIRIPNQSLILDFFCIDEVFTDFLRKEVFCDKVARNNAWKLINLRDSDPNGSLAAKDLHDLLSYKDSQLKDIWLKIISSTAKNQDNSEILLMINKLISNLAPRNISPPTGAKEFTDLVEGNMPKFSESFDSTRESIGSKAMQKDTLTTKAGDEVGIRNIDSKQKKLRVRFSLVACVAGLSCLFIFESIRHRESFFGESMPPSPYIKYDIPKVNSARLEVLATVDPKDKNAKLVMGVHSDPGLIVLSFALTKETARTNAEMKCMDRLSIPFDQCRYLDISRGYIVMFAGTNGAGISVADEILKNATKGAKEECIRGSRPEGNGDDCAIIFKYKF